MRLICQKPHTGSRCCLRQWQPGWYKIIAARIRENSNSSPKRVLVRRLLVLQLEPLRDTRAKSIHLKLPERSRSLFHPLGIRVKKIINPSRQKPAVYAGDPVARGCTSSLGREVSVRGAERGGRGRLTRPRVLREHPPSPGTSPL